MILVWGLPTDPPTSAVLTALARLGTETFFLDQSAPVDAEFLPSASGHPLEGSLLTTAGSLDLADVTGAYIRPVDTTRKLNDQNASGAERLRCAMLEAALLSWADVASARIVNRPAAMASNNSKPYQAAIIHAHGFAVPESIITTDAKALREFRARHGALIYKSSSGIRSIVSRYDALDGSRCVEHAACPTMFQRWIPGTDIRVHVIGNEVLAAEVVSSATDYRYPATELEQPALHAFCLPDMISQRCVELAAALGLAFAGIDLRRSDTGAWVCFEANPSPGFTYYEEATGLAIARSVAELLCGR